MSPTAATNLPLRCPSCDVSMVGDYFLDEINGDPADGWRSRWEPVYRERLAWAPVFAWKCPYCWHFERPREGGDG